MTEPLPTSLRDVKDQRLIHFLRRKQSHSDIGLPLLEAVDNLPRTTSFSTDPGNFGCIIACVGDRVFAFAEGMQGLTLRLSPASARTALADGARASEIGDGWYFFELFVQTRASKAINAWIARAHADTLADCKLAD
jgi:hypothetical protein